MLRLNEVLLEQIVEACFKLYHETPKSGKPLTNEWTVLSCIVKYNRSSRGRGIEVVSLGTGSKCLGATKISPRGDTLNDSHAEVFTRRGFLLYLYENIEKCLKKEASIFVYNNKKFTLKRDIEFAFFSSQLPCGDASIVPKSETEGSIGHILQINKRKIDDGCEPEPKKRKVENDVHRTGAKCLPNSNQDLRESGAKYHILGQVRTKPGRGDRTLSVSCSDKMARWIHLGIQGSLLSLLCDPIYISHFIFGAGVPYSSDSLHRALLNRNAECTIKPEIIPEFYQSSLQFHNKKTKNSVRPAAGSIVWIKLRIPLADVAVHGRKLGTTNKDSSLVKNSLCISKYNLYKRFIQIIASNEHLKDTISKDIQVELVPYNEMKNRATEYKKRWLEVKETFFKTWTVKPNMWDFCVELT